MFGLFVCYLEMFFEFLVRGIVVNKYREERGNFYFKCGDEIVVLSFLVVIYLFFIYGNCSNLE